MNLILVSNSTSSRVYDPHDVANNAVEVKYIPRMGAYTHALVTKAVQAPMQVVAHRIHQVSVYADLAVKVRLMVVVVVEVSVDDLVIEDDAGVVGDDDSAGGLGDDIVDDAGYPHVQTRNDIGEATQNHAPG